MLSSQNTLEYLDQGVPSSIFPKVSHVEASRLRLLSDFLTRFFSDGSKNFSREYLGATWAQNYAGMSVF
jgi:hypothetical protein